MLLSEILSFSLLRLTAEGLAWVSGIAAGVASCRYCWKEGLKFPPALIGVFTTGFALTYLAAHGLVVPFLVSFTDEAVNAKRLSQIDAGLDLYLTRHGTYPADLESLVPDYLDEGNEEDLFMKGKGDMRWGYIAGARYEKQRPSQVILYSPVLVEGMGVVVHRDGMIVSYPAEKFRALVAEALKSTKAER